MQNNNTLKGHLLAAFTILVWGTTFTSTKVLLESFTPIEILINRFVLGLIILTLLYPHKFQFGPWEKELLFAAAGFTGLTSYYLCENMALALAPASVVGTIMAIAPFFTAVLAHRFLQDEHLNLTFFLSFVLAMGGVLLVSTNAGRAGSSIDVTTFLLAMGGSLSWGCYSVLVKRIGSRDNILAVTRHIFLYGLCFMLPAAYLMDYRLKLELILQPLNLANYLFLGMGASALCFVTWNQATKYIGAVKTSMYIYLSPVINVLTAVMVLGEALTWGMAAGTALLLLGLIMAERRK